MKAKLLKLAVQAKGLLSLALASALAARVLAEPSDFG